MDIQNTTKVNFESFFYETMDSSTLIFYELKRNFLHRYRMRFKNQLLHLKSLQLFQGSTLKKIIYYNNII